MSNVSVREIFDLTAAAFGVSVGAMAKHYRGRHRSKIPLPLIARGAGVILASRHTLATAPEIARAMGWDSRTAGSRFTALGKKVAPALAKDAGLAAMLAAAEDAIDELHERRLDAIERFTSAGFGGLAPTPVQINRARARALSFRAGAEHPSVGKAQQSPIFASS
jgi:hypothetical protein